MKHKKTTPKISTQYFLQFQIKKSFVFRKRTEKTVTLRACRHKLSVIIATVAVQIALHSLKVTLLLYIIIVKIISKYMTIVNSILTLMSYNIENRDICGENPINIYLSFLEM